MADVYQLQKEFNKPLTNINLPSNMPSTTPSLNKTYTKYNFLKLHERSTPRHLLHDLLINNHLKDPALSLVKSRKDINAIWDRHKFSYGEDVDQKAQPFIQHEQLSQHQRSRSYCIVTYLAGCFHFTFIQFEHTST